MNRREKYPLKVCMGVSVCAFDGSQNVRVTPSIEKISKELITTEISTAENVYTKKLFNFQRFKSSVKAEHIDISDLELAKAIRETAGEDPEIVNSMPDDILLTALNYQEVIVQDIYLKASESGAAEIISKEQCEKEVTEARASEFIKAAVSNDTTLKSTMPVSSGFEYVPDKEETFNFDNGYMRITTAATRIAKNPGGDETWLASGRAEWLKIPNYRLVDMITIASTALYDGDYDQNEYGYKKCYRECAQVGITAPYHEYKGWYESTVTKVYNGNYGVSYKADFDPDVCDKLNAHDAMGVLDHKLTVDTGHVYYGQYAVNTGRNNDFFNVLVGYGHRYLGISGVGVNISTGGTAGVSMSFNYGTEEYIAKAILVKPTAYK